MNMQHETARRQVVDALEALMAGSGRAPDLADLGRVLAGLRDLDPAMRRRIGRAVMQAHGDPAAMRAAVEAAVLGRDATAAQASATDVPRASDAPRGADVARAPTPAPQRPPTVVDARGGLPWAAIAVAAVAAAIVAALLSGAFQ